MPEWGVPHKARGPSLRPGKGRVCGARDLGAVSWSLRLSKGRAGWLASQPSPALVRTQQPRPPSPSSPRPIRPEISASQNFPLGNLGLPCRNTPGPRCRRNPAGLHRSPLARRPGGMGWGGDRAAQLACATQRRPPPLARAEASPHPAAPPPTFQRRAATRLARAPPLTPGFKKHSHWSHGGPKPRKSEAKTIHPGPRAATRGNLSTTPPPPPVTNQLGCARVRRNARAPSPSARLRTDTKAAIVLGPGTIPRTEPSWRTNRL